MTGDMGFGQLQQKKSTGTVPQIQSRLLVRQKARVGWLGKFDSVILRMVNSKHSGSAKHSHPSLQVLLSTVR